MSHTMKTLLTGVALGLVGTTEVMANGGTAATPPQPLTVMPSSSGFDWTGPYVGAVVGFGMLNSETSDHWCNVACDGGSLASGGGGAGLAIGYDWQMDDFVVGVVLDYMATNFENINIHDYVDPDTPANSYTSYTESSWDSVTTLRARAGIAADRTLFYATGGVAWVDVNYRHDYNYGEAKGSFYNEGYLPYSGTEMGIAAGAGVERAVGENLSISAEYLYVGLESVDGGYYYDDFDDVPGSREDSTVDYRSSAHMVRVGIKYRF